MHCINDWGSLSRLRKWPILGNFDTYIKQAMIYHHKGVHHPFWHDWPLSDPSENFTPEPLHHWHKMFWDHDAQWCICTVGPAEIVPSFTPTLVFDNSLKASLNWNRSLDENITISNTTLLQPLLIAFWRTFSLLSMLWLIFGIYLKHLRFQMKYVHE